MAGDRMTRPVPAATLPVIRALLDQASRKKYSSGVLGVRARPQWAGPATFMYGDATVLIVPCESALAVREAIAGRDRAQWLVVLTDRPDEDLGVGIRAHLLWHRLRTPDPWDAVRERFAARGIDPALTSVSGHRDVAVGLLAAAPPDGWPPAPAGILTRDHAFVAVAAAHLAFADPVVDLTSVLSWTAHPGVAARIADLRELVGDPLTDEVLAWSAGRCGTVSGPLLGLLRAGEASDAVPLGLVAGLLAAAAGGTDADRSRLGREGLIRIEPRLGGVPPPAALASWGTESAAVIIDQLTDRTARPRGEALLARADELLAAAHAEGIADDSDLLPAGLTRRLAGLASAVRRAFAGGASRMSGELDDPWLGPDDLAGIEQAWSRVAAHQLAGQDEPRAAAFHAAARLARWLSAAPNPPAGPSAPQAVTDFGGLVGRHLADDAWVDSAVNDAAPGVSDPDLGSGLAAVLAAATARRAAHDSAFAAALAAYTAAEGEPGSGHGTGAAAGFYCLEDLLPEVVIPLARQTPVLLLILDGMSAGNATEIIASLLARSGDGWAEALLPGTVRRAAGLAVLPSVTEVSRASLLCGRLSTCGQDGEKRGYETLWRERGLTGANLFHKKPLDSSLLGHAVAGDVAAAIADVTGTRLVTCVLNTIDDALDRSDPGGTEWTAFAVRHLIPLLDRARHAGRVVILTADHGHVVERRQGVQRFYPEVSSGRSRPATEPAGPGEILVAGDRVLMHGRRAVLAVDERIRYGPLKAGYHGGGSPAEAVVPVAVLLPGGVPDGTQLHLAPPQEPAWWADPAAMPGPTLLSAAGREQAPGGRAGRARSMASVGDARLRSAPGAEPTLFDLPGEEAESARADQAGPTAVAWMSGPPGLTASSVVGSAVYAAQRKIGGRLSVSDDRVRDLLAALLAAPAGRLSPAQAAAVLQVAPVALRGAVLHVQRLLNVEGYAVLRIDADGATVILDEPLLREQFGVRA